MALGKYSRVDGRKSTNYISSITFVVFVALCLLGVWIMTSSSSSSIVPLKNVLDSETEVKQSTQVSETNVVVDTPTQSNVNTDNQSKQFEDNPGDLPEDATKGDITTTESPVDSDGKKSDESKATNEAQSQTPEEKKEVFPSGAQSELSNETVTQDASWATQAAESNKETTGSLESDTKTGYSWKICNVTAGPDYIPCLDNLQAIRSLRSTKHYEHRERHCPEDPPTCLVSLPEGYQRSIEWPTSREKV